MLPKASPLLLSVLLGCTPSKPESRGHDHLLRWAAQNATTEYSVEKVKIQQITKEEYQPSENHIILKDDAEKTFYFRVEKLESIYSSDAMQTFADWAKSATRLAHSHWQELAQILEPVEEINLALSIRNPNISAPSHLAEIPANLPDSIRIQIQDIFPPKILSPGLYLQTYAGMHLSPWLSLSGIKLVLQEMRRRASSGASYNHETSQYEFSDPTLRMLSELLFDEIFGTKARAQQIKERAPKLFEQILYDTNTISENSRTEIFDLLTNIERSRFIARDVRMAKFTIPPISLTSLIKASVQLRLTNETGEHLPLAIFRPADGSKRLLLVCSSPSSQLISRTISRSLASTDRIGLSWIYIEQNKVEEDPGLKWNCAGESYRFSVEKELDQRTLSSPLRVAGKFRTKKLSALVTFALTDGLSPSQLEIYTRAVNSLISCEKIEKSDIQSDLKNIIKNDFIQTDLYFPVAHRLHLGEILLSSSSHATRVKLTKCNELNLEVILYLPRLDARSSKTPAVKIGRTEAASWLVDRMTTDVGQLFIMNMSCFSQLAVPGWMASFRDAARQSESQKIPADEIPIIIASTRGFATSATEVLEHMKFAVSAVKHLRQGSSLAELQNSLNEKTEENRGFEAIGNWQPDFRREFSLDQKSFRLFSHSKDFGF